MLDEADPRMKGAFFSFCIILNIMLQGRLEVPISFIRVRPEAALIHHYRPCAEYEMKVARHGDMLVLIICNSITRETTRIFIAEIARRRRDIGIKYYNYATRLLGVQFGD